MAERKPTGDVVLVNDSKTHELFGVHDAQTGNKSDGTPGRNGWLFKFFSLRGMISSILHHENTIWFILIFAPIWRPVLIVIESIYNPKVLYTIGSIYELINSFSYEFLSSAAVLFMLVCFNVIFGSTPIQIMRKSVERRRLNEVLQQQSSLSQTVDSPTEQTSRRTNSTASVEMETLGRALDNVDAEIARDRVSSYNSHQLLSLYALESRRIAVRSQARAGVFLFVGTIIAGLGLGFFYYFNVYIIKTSDFTENNVRASSSSSVNIEESKYSPDATDKILFRLPGIAILFFIEFVALYFIRLFRSTMDEYRRYEEIARARETTLVALKISFERGDNSDVKQILEQSRLFSISGRLVKDETTEFLESRKLQKDEIILLEGIIDVLNRRSGSNDTKNKDKK